MEKGVLEPRVYELGYHVLPFVPEADLEKEVDAIKKALTDVGGLPIKIGDPKMIELAYPMYKIIDNKRTEFNQAYFGWIKFDVSPNRMAEFKAFLDKNANLLRFLIVQTVREDTYIEPKGFVDATKEEEKEEVAAPVQAEEAAEKPAEPVDEGEVNEEALDKQLDEMVAEE